MTALVYVTGMRGPAEAKRLAGQNGVVVNTTSRAKGSWERDLSPFSLGPCQLYSDNSISLSAEIFENAWQYAKVYRQYADKNGDPTAEYWKWAVEGWASKDPHRYPMGKGARPLYSLWEGEKLGYIDARKRIYAPLYAEAVQKTDGWKQLVKLYQTRPIIVLRDYDGYRYDIGGDTLTHVLNNPRQIMGHAFVLKMLLTQDAALQQLDLRP